MYLFSLKYLAETSTIPSSSAGMIGRKPKENWDETSCCYGSTAQAA